MVLSAKSMEGYNWNSCHFEYFDNWNSSVCLIKNIRCKCCSRSSRHTHTNHKSQILRFPHLYHRLLFKCAGFYNCILDIFSWAWVWYGVLKVSDPRCNVVSFQIIIFKRNFISLQPFELLHVWVSFAMSFIVQNDLRKNGLHLSTSIFIPHLNPLGCSFIPCTVTLNTLEEITYKSSWIILQTY